jgi:hypothetical protein
MERKEPEKRVRNPSVVVDPETAYGGESGGNRKRRLALQLRAQMERDNFTYLGGEEHPLPTVTDLQRGNARVHDEFIQQGLVAVAGAGLSTRYLTFRNRYNDIVNTPVGRPSIRQLQRIDERRRDARRIEADRRPGTSIESERTEGKLTEGQTITTGSIDGEAIRGRTELTSEKIPARDTGAGFGFGGLDDEPVIPTVARFSGPRTRVFDESVRSDLIVSSHSRQAPVFESISRRLVDLQPTEAPLFADVDLDDILGTHPSLSRDPVTLLRDQAAIRDSVMAFFDNSNMAGMLTNADREYAVREIAKTVDDARVSGINQEIIEDTVSGVVDEIMDRHNIDDFASSMTRQLIEGIMDMANKGDGDTPGTEGSLLPTDPLVDEVARDLENTDFGRDPREEKANLGDPSTNERQVPNQVQREGKYDQADADEGKHNPAIVNQERKDEFEPTRDLADLARGFENAYSFIYGDGYEANAPILASGTEVDRVRRGIQQIGHVLNQPSVNSIGADNLNRLRGLVDTAREVVDRMDSVDPNLVGRVTDLITDPSGRPANLAGDFIRDIADRAGVSGDIRDAPGVFDELGGVVQSAARGFVNGQGASMGPLPRIGRELINTIDFDRNGTISQQERDEARMNDALG